MPQDSSCCSRFHTAARETESAAASSSPECSAPSASSRSSSARPLIAAPCEAATARAFPRAARCRCVCARDCRGAPTRRAPPWRHRTTAADNDSGAVTNTAIGTDTGGRDRREPDESGQHDDDQPGAGCDGEQHRRKREQHAGERRAALAAAKVVPERPDVADDRRRGAAHGEPVAPDDGIRDDAGNRERRQPARRQPALADVDDDGACGEAESLRAQRIGAARVSAAHRADVDAAQLPDQRARRRSSPAGRRSGP